MGKKIIYLFTKDHMELILVILVLFGATDLSQGQRLVIPGGPAAEAPGLTPDWSSIASTACSSYGGNIGTMDNNNVISYNRVLQFLCTSSKPCVLAINPETLTYATSQFTNRVVNVPRVAQIVGYVPGVTSGCITMYTTDYGSYTYQYSDDCTGDMLCLSYGSFYGGGLATSLPNTTPAWNSGVSTACNQWPKIPARFNSHIDEFLLFGIFSLTCAYGSACVLAIDVRTWMWVEANGNEVINVSYPLQSQISGFIPGATTGCITVNATQWPLVYAYNTSCDGWLLCSTNYNYDLTTTTATPNAPRSTTTRWIDWITLPDFVNSAGAASIFGFWILSFLAALLWLIQQ